MTAEMYQAAEEAFVEKYLDLGDDDETKASNRTVLQNLVLEYRKKAELLADQMETGLCFSDTDAILVIQMLAFAKKYLDKMS